MFKAREIASQIGVDEGAVSTALSRLKARDLVEHKATYWAITDDAERLEEYVATIERPRYSTSNSVRKTRRRGVSTHPNTTAVQTLNTGGFKTGKAWMAEPDGHERNP